MTARSSCHTQSIWTRRSTAPAKHGERLMVLMTARSHDHAPRRAFLLVEYDTPRGCLGAYFPETNSLVPLHSTARRRHTHLKVDPRFAGAQQPDFDDLDIIVYMGYRLLN